MIGRSFQMAENLVMKVNQENPSDGRSDYLGVSSNGLSSLFHRTIEFHPARKPLCGLINSGGDFQLETLNPSSSDFRQPGSNQGQSTLKGKKADDSETLEYALDPELSFEITFRRIGAGLENLGNTCFLNSVLQCLTYTEPLVAYLQSGKHQNSCHIAGFCALCAIQKHVSRALQSSGRILAPKDLVSNLRCISRNFRNCRQEDAHEYMVNLLETMHKCCLPSGLPSESPIAYEKSLVHKIFGGRLRSQVKCTQCSYCSNTFDPFLDLSLEIVKADSLHKALKNFTAAELLDGGERQYQCQRCKQKVRALKQLTVYKAPYVLTIHLKRFHSHNPAAKIHKKIHFDPSLDMKPFVSGSSDGDLKYTLYGVLVHNGGSTHSGHYYCYVRTSSGMWYTLDDNRVFHVKESTVLEQQAYMLFYVRDRKTVPRKPVDMKENVKANVNKNIACSISTQVLKVPVQNNINENRLKAAASSTDATKRDTFNGSESKTSILKGVPVWQDNGILRQESMMTKTDSVSEPSSVALLTKESVKGKSAPIPQSEGINDASPNPETAMTSSSAMKLGSVNENGPNGDLRTHVSQPTGDLKSSPPAKLAKDEALPKGVNLASTEASSRTSENTDPLISSDQSKSVNDEVVASKSSVVYPPCKDASDGSHKLVVDDSVKLSSASIVANGSILVVAVDCKPDRKLKKRLLKYQVASMRLRSNIFFGGTLSLRKRKKHKRSKKRCVIDKKCLTKVDCILDLGPSTSEKTTSISLVSSHSQKKRTKHESKGGNGSAVNNINSNSEPLVNTVDEAYKRRIVSGDATLANDKRNVHGFSSKANQGGGVREANCSKESKRDVGLEETVVACWDGVELPRSQIVESNRASSLSIGYIGDEWDEEYDRGKRKKLRLSKRTFGGSNPFQEIAIQKSQMKKGKMDQSSSGNRPFRI